MICSSLLVQNIIWEIKHWFMTTKRKKKKTKTLSENEVYLINLTLYLIKWIYKTSTANIILIGKKLDSICSWTPANMTQFNIILSWPSSETEKAWEMGREWEEGKRDAGKQYEHWKKRKKTVIYKCYDDTCRKY